MSRLLVHGEPSTAWHGEVAGRLAEGDEKRNQELAKQLRCPCGRMLREEDNRSGICRPCQRSVIRRRAMWPEDVLARIEGPVLLWRLEQEVLRFDRLYKKWQKSLETRQRRRSQQLQEQVDKAALRIATITARWVRGGKR